MAAIDKIYLHSYDDYVQFKNWCDTQPPLKDKYNRDVPISMYLYKYIDKDCNWDYGVPVMNAPCYVDAYIIKNCPFEFVHDAIRINYGYITQDEIDDWYDIVKNRSVEDQKIIDEFNNKNHDEHSVPMRHDKNCIPCWWMSIDDFEIVGDKVVYKKLKKSTYEEILDGTCHDFDSPRRDNTAIAKHFRMTKCPRNNGFSSNYNRPAKGSWFVEIESVDDKYDSMWFNHVSDDFSNHGTWDFMDEFVKDLGGSSNCTHVKTIKSLKRLLIKWKLPVNMRVIVRGYYVGEDYEFITTK